ncbi:MAG: hypothetical protein A2Z16_13970 [Chloroflexi bacterium RBG_16_54_18]|nr:MAG: hypothetical protein A2Z16_13970 [Chloroflexi bacterium RBG_16_54_18]
MNETRPAGITANRDTAQLSIQWSDGHASLYPFSLLRRACPCAECRGGHANMGGQPDPAWFEVEIEDSPQTRIRNVEAVGAYAMTIEWEDGHHYGIYNWKYLRALCPCPICRAEAIGTI